MFHSTCHRYHSKFLERLGPGSGSKKKNIFESWWVSSAYSQWQLVGFPHFRETDILHLRLDRKKTNRAYEKKRLEELLARRAVPEPVACCSLLAVFFGLKSSARIGSNMEIMDSE